MHKELYGLPVDYLGIAHYYQCHQAPLHQSVALARLSELCLTSLTALQNSLCRTLCSACNFWGGTSPVLWSLSRSSMAREISVIRNILFIIYLNKNVTKPQRVDDDGGGNTWWKQICYLLFDPSTHLTEDMITQTIFCIITSRIQWLKTVHRLGCFAIYDIVLVHSNLAANQCYHFLWDYSQRQHSISIVAIFESLTVNCNKLSRY